MQSLLAVWQRIAIPEVASITLVLARALDGADKV
jgi:hypothetical protein